MAFLSVPESSSYLSGIPFSSQAFLALRWMMSGMILGEVALQSGFTWWLSLPTWGSMMSYLVAVVGGGAFRGM
jgi:hypothetical protein